MKISQVKIGRTVSLGQFENFRVDLTAEVEPQDNPADVVASLTVEVEELAKALKEQWQSKPPPSVNPIKHSNNPPSLPGRTR